jgi:hypothetical protein
MKMMKNPQTKINKSSAMRIITEIIIIAVSVEFAIKYIGPKINERIEKFQPRFSFKVCWANETFSKSINKFVKNNLPYTLKENMFKHLLSSKKFTF